jgi:ferritin-like metal-binding protein YciE
MEKSTNLGGNRTGIDISPIHSKQMQKDVQQYPPGNGGGNRLDSIERAYIEQADRLGSVPIPGTAKGLLKSMMKKFTGNQPEIFINKMGERLAFERAGTRVYESLILKCEVAESQGKNSINLPIDRIKNFHNEELQHFHMLADCMKKLGADPTAQTPDADVSAVAGSGMMKVISDPRTTVPQCLEAMLALELTDNAAWELLIQLAQDLGQDDMANRFQAALAEEQVHLREIRSWYEQSVRGQATSGTTH